MKKIILSIFLIFAFASVAFAATDTVMLVSDKTSVDGSIAAAAAAKTGSPAMVLENGMLNDATLSAIKELAPAKVVLVGGPAVINAEVETRLKEIGIDVIRLWGMERTGTAIEAARHFWPEGSNCAVLVTDTKNSDVDNARQRVAAQFASHYNCTLVPVPEGIMPSEVLAMLDDLNVSNVWYIGKTSMPGVRETLKKFKLHEVLGDDDSLERQMLNDTGRNISKLVIVATPDWKAAVALDAIPGEHSVVRHVSNASNLSEIISYIKYNNITDVRVVGIPMLAQQVANVLNLSNISVIKISGEKANEISREALKKWLGDWESQRAKHDAQKERQATHIRERLLNELNNTIQKLDEAQTEIESMNQTNSTLALATIINASQAKIPVIRALIANGSFDTANKMLAEIKSDFREQRFLLRDKVGMNENSDDEEQDVGDARIGLMRDLAKAEGKLADIRDRCKDVSMIEALTTQTNSMTNKMQTAYQGGDYVHAAQYGKEARKTVNLARQLTEKCRKTDKLEDAAKKRIDRLNIKINITANTTAERTKTNVIEMTSSDFSPKDIEVKKGDTVTFVNKDSVDRWPASAMHPTHRVYPGSDIAKCDTEDEKNIFDACRGIKPGYNYTFTFNQNGTWYYHDHLIPTMFGSVAVSD